MVLVPLTQRLYPAWSSSPTKSRGSRSHRRTGNRRDCCAAQPTESGGHQIQPSAQLTIPAHGLHLQPLDGETCGRDGFVAGLGRRNSGSDLKELFDGLRLVAS